MSPQLESLSNKRNLHRKISKTCRQAKLRRLRRLLHFNGACNLELFPDYMDYLHRFVRCLDYRDEDTYRCKIIFFSKSHKHDNFIASRSKKLLQKAKYPWFHVVPWLSGMPRFILQPLPLVTNKSWFELNECRYLVVTTLIVSSNTRDSLNYNWSSAILLWYPSMGPLKHTA